MRQAEAGEYVFKVPKFQPRNSKNTPDNLEARILRQMKDNGLKEYYTVDEETNAVHYFRAVYLTESCLYCHGDPAKAEQYWGNRNGLDPTGVRMEGWHSGEMHGAFEIIHSLNADRRRSGLDPDPVECGLHCFARPDGHLYFPLRDQGRGQPGPSINANDRRPWKRANWITVSPPHAAMRSAAWPKHERVRG